jgi:hypothetical protein
MTPKNKAKDLIKKFTIIADDSNGMYYMDIATKEKALIAVDELQDFICKYDNHVPDFKYWEQVRKEIEKL